MVHISEISLDKGRKTAMVVYTLRKNLLGCSFFFWVVLPEKSVKGLAYFFAGAYIYMCSVNNVTHIALDMTL